MSERRYEYAARVTNVVDADTLDLTIDLGFGVLTKQRVRLYGPDPDGKLGMDAPEKNTPEGKAAITYLKHAFEQTGSEVVVRTLKDRREKYGRYLAVVYLWYGPNLNQLLVDQGHAKLKAYSELPGDEE